MSSILYTGDCLDIIPTLKPGSVDAVITDPPYGCGKADWDNTFPKEWYSLARSVAPMSVIITGAAGLADSVPLVGADFVDVVAAWNTNGMTRGPLGFNNWLAAVVAGVKPKGLAQNVLRFSIRGDKPAHPSPKPIEYMVKLIEQMTKPGHTILDPFMGSGTTGVACAMTGRNFIGIEIDPEYAEIARKRIEHAEAQLRQETLL